ncbi:hypothetical protein HNR12_002199 [Streptomonospora nanhaiensis]|uniref:Uncharacterized protein n=1 Tax=Streptomonospora nanhaiensis TaxID=1323731 RepID=A0A853BN90_9ACTN|nr:hypothetical protein [Streptomonospora nanhaiensis]NYI95922.1 hypothetical protein [Streptomonospora nanhaiensis]
MPVPADPAEPVVLTSLIAPALLAEMAGPRRINESYADYRARQAAFADITADLADEYAAGGGDEWFETDPEDLVA